LCIPGREGMRAPSQRPSLFPEIAGLWPGRQVGSTGNLVERLRGHRRRVDGVQIDLVVLVGQEFGAVSDVDPGAVAVDHRAPDRQDRIGPVGTEPDEPLFDDFA
jgi:hypothetical protein